VDASVEIALVVPDHPYVGRGGLKLAHALDAPASMTDRAALDIGASTGGFTDALPARAASVVALDVGHG
jgi:23S rRNA (cytidine1920-2'-O)/16S rRNA (cytidine1409-2'-O)-methyltransferase